MKILCTVCVRAGSKGLRDKNFLKINNKYLLCYTLDVAIKSKIFDQIVVSTDSKKIRTLKKKYKNIDFIKRPQNLATDSANKIDAIRHAMKFSEKKKDFKYDIIFDLDATSALRNTSDIKKALKIFKKNNADNLFSVNKSRRNPYFNVVEKIKGKIKIVKQTKKNIFRRQNAPQTYDMNASIYIWRRKILISSNNLFRKKTFIYIMDIKRSIDVDNKFDLTLIRNLIRR